MHWGRGYGSFLPGMQSEKRGAHDDGSGKRRLLSSREKTTYSLRRISDMNEYIAYCGLDCEACEARLATVNNDDELRQRVAKEWSELNGVEITAEMINCSGCRIPGVKTPYCDSLCLIRPCARLKQMETCGNCPEMNSCEKLAMITGNNADALRRLKEQSGECDDNKK